MRAPDNINRGRVRMSKQEIFDACNATMEKILDNNDLADKPDEIFNVGDPALIWRSRRLWFQKGSRSAHCVEKGSKEHRSSVV